MKKRDTIHKRLVRLARKRIDENSCGTWVTLPRGDGMFFAFTRLGHVAKEARAGLVRMIEDALD